MLHQISNSAAKYKKYIVPLISVSVDFYVRLFVQVFTSPGLTRLTSTCAFKVVVLSRLLMTRTFLRQNGLAYCCTGCHAVTTQSLGTVRGLPSHHKQTIVCGRMKETNTATGGPTDEKKVDETSEFEVTLNTPACIHPQDYKQSPADVNKLKILPMVGPAVSRKCDECSRGHHVHCFPNVSYRYSTDSRISH